MCTGTLTKYFALSNTNVFTDRTHIDVILDTGVKGKFTGAGVVERHIRRTWLQFLAA